MLKAPPPSQAGTISGLWVPTHPRTIEAAFDCVRTGGRLGMVGYTHEAVFIVAGKIMFKEIEIVGSLRSRPFYTTPREERLTAR